LIYDFMLRSFMDLVILVDISVTIDVTFYYEFNNKIKSIMKW